METEKSSWKSLGPSASTKLPESTNCLACSEDGRYLGLGHSRGLSLWCASSLTCVADWLQDSVEITWIQMNRMAETAYLLATIDDMGVARVFAYRCDSIHLLSVVNVMEDVNKRSICLTFELSQGGHYGVASMSCRGDVWLEMHHLPIETWLKELETRFSQTQDTNLSEDVDMKWSPSSVVTIIKPPRIPDETALAGPDELQATDCLTRCLALDIVTKHHHLEKHSFNADEEKTKETNASPRRCTHHFLLPCGGRSSVASQSAELPVAVCVWWSGSHSLLQYMMQKAPKSKPDVEPKPDVLCPNAKEILCSAVSRCTRYIALGLTDALVSVWDRLSGSPLSVVVLSAADGASSRVQFAHHRPAPADDRQTCPEAEVYLLVVCKSGAIHTVATGRGTRSCTTLLAERPEDSGDFPTITAPVPFLQSLFLRVQRDGKMILQDVLNKQTACFLIPPKTHLIATPCNPVYVLHSKLQTLFVRGDPDPSCRASSIDNSQSQLFIYRFGESDILKQYIDAHADSRPQQKPLSFATLEENCDLYLLQRALCVDERNRDITETWRQLETAAMAQRGAAVN